MLCMQCTLQASEGRSSPSACNTWCSRPDNLYGIKVGAVLCWCRSVDALNPAEAAATAAAVAAAPAARDAAAAQEAGAEPSSSAAAARAQPEKALAAQRQHTGGLAPEAVRGVVAELPPALLRQLPALLGAGGLSAAAAGRVAACLRALVAIAPAHRPLLLAVLEAELRRRAFPTAGQGFHTLCWA